MCERLGGIYTRYTNGYVYTSMFYLNFSGEITRKILGNYIYTLLRMFGNKAIEMMILLGDISYRTIL